MNKWICSILFLLLIASCRPQVELDPVCLVACSQMPSPVAAGCWFASDDAVYVFGGRKPNGVYSNQFWRYSLDTDSWTQLNGCPLKARVSSSACVLGDKVYMGLGYTGPIHRDSSYMRDFWSYTPATQEWVRLADFPANITVKNVLFASDDAIYAAYGFYRQFTQDIYRYDIANDRWDKLNTTTQGYVPRAMDIVGAECQGRYFLGTGFNRGSLRFWAEWIPEKSQFVAREKILGAGRNAVACCATSEHVYIAGGRHYGDTLTNGYFYRSIQRYSPDLDTWEYVGDMPYEAENMVAISVNGQLYIGMGETPNGEMKNDWYRIED